ncbi:MAG TPA: hypothetical protein VLA02_14140 [Reyranella sp.]|nr:hypothetical protein [Reyranella sp.]
MIRRFAFAAILLGFAGPSAAQGLQGVWQFQRQGHDGRYTGTVVIDANSDARATGRSERQTYSQCGFVQIKGDVVEIIFTSVNSERPYSPDRFFCTSSGGAALVCYNRDAAGHREPATFVLTRIGGIPATPAGRLEDVCPPRERPTSQARPAGDFA